MELSLKEQLAKLHEVEEINPQEIDSIEEWENDAWTEYLREEEKKKCIKEATESGHMGDYEWMLESNQK